MRLMRQMSAVSGAPRRAGETLFVNEDAAGRRTYGHQRCATPRLAGIMGWCISGYRGHPRCGLKAFQSCCDRARRVLQGSVRSAYRFERGVDLAGARADRKRDTLIMQICGGQGSVNEAQGTRQRATKCSAFGPGHAGIGFSNRRRTAYRYGQSGV